MKVQFDIGNAGLAHNQHFVHQVTQKIPGLAIRQMMANDQVITFEAETENPVNLLLLGAAIWIHNEQIGYWSH